jgi:hypothetical protein
VPLMLLCDGLYYWMLSQGFYLGETYANTLNALFIVQLLAVGWPGAAIGGRTVVYWVFCARRSVVGGVSSRRDGGQGPES